jgi:hypothetical protein
VGKTDMQDLNVRCSDISEFRSMGPLRCLLFDGNHRQTLGDFKFSSSRDTGTCRDEFSDPPSSVTITGRIDGFDLDI